MIRKIFKTGHSLAVTVSPTYLKELGLKEGDSVKIELDKKQGCIVIGRGKKQNQLTLDLKVRPKLK